MVTDLTGTVPLLDTRILSKPESLGHTPSNTPVTAALHSPDDGAVVGWACGFFVGLCFGAFVGFFVALGFFVGDDGGVVGDVVDGCVGDAGGCVGDVVEVDGCTVGCTAGGVVGGCVAAAGGCVGCAGGCVGCTAGGVVGCAPPPETPGVVEPIGPHLISEYFTVAAANWLTTEV